MMKEINYALAPAGATHEHNGMWRKVEGDLPDDYHPIPKREIALNRLADSVVEWHKDIARRAYVDKDDEVLFPLNIIVRESFGHEEWQARRADRIEAGLVEVDNPITSSLTNSQAREMELDMLKQNNNLADVNGTDVVEWDGNGLPPVGERCESNLVGAGMRTGWLSYIGNRLIVWVDAETGDEIANRPWDRKFRPIKTPEQKKQEWVESVNKQVAKEKGYLLSEKHTSAIYDALLYGILEAPKEDL